MRMSIRRHHLVHRSAGRHFRATTDSQRRRSARGLRRICVDLWRAGRWWPGGSSEYPPWPEKLAGADRALQRASRPIEFAHRVLADPAGGPNLLQEAAFDAVTSEGMPTGWWTWQDDRSAGKLQHQEGTAHAQQVAQGVFGQLIPVVPGQTYVVQARVRSEGRGFASLVIGWKTEDGRWTADSSRYQFAPHEADSQGTWRDVSGLVEVPPSAGQLAFMLSVEGQLSDADQRGLMIAG